MTLALWVTKYNKSVKERHGANPSWVMYIYICLYVYIYIYIYMYVCMYVGMYVCMYVCYICIFLVYMHILDFSSMKEP